MTNIPTDEHIRQFIQHLYQQTYPHNPTGKKTLAILRRASANPEHSYDILWVIGDHLPRTDDWSFDVYRLVAVLFSVHQQQFGDRKLPSFSQDVYQRSFGASLRRFRDQLSVGEKSLDQRFSALLSTHRDNLMHPLRMLTQRMAHAKRPIPIDFFLLTKDLLYWPHRNLGSRTVSPQRRWSQHYWQPDLPPEPTS